MVLGYPTLFTDQVKVDMKQIQGNSGAPVTYNLPSTPVQPGGFPTSNLVGIATMATPDFSACYVSKAANINSTFGLSTYTVI